MLSESLWSPSTESRERSRVPQVSLGHGSLGERSLVLMADVADKACDFWFGPTEVTDD